MYGIVAMSIGVALASLAVEVGRVHVVKTQLQTLADAASRAAAEGYAYGGMGEARTQARGVAALSTVDGGDITFSDADFIFGHWNADAGQFETPGSGKPIDAIKVMARCTVPLTFAGFFGKSSIDVTASAIGRAPDPNAYAGFVALDGVDFKNTAYIGSYSSNSTLTPTPANSSARGAITSNGLISFKNNGTVNGNIVLGPAGLETHFMGLVITGSVKKLPGNVPPPPDPAWAPAPNPLGIPQNYTVNSATVLPGGTYWFTSLKISKKLTFAGPATLYVNGDIWTDDEIVTAGSIPANLKIYQIGSNRTLESEKDLHLVAEVHAPGAALVAKNKLYLIGQGVYRSIDAKNHASLFYDRNSAPAAQAMAEATNTDEGTSILMVQ